MKSIKDVSLLLTLLLISPALGLMAQEKVDRQVSIEELFELADANSRTIKMFTLSQQEAAEGVGQAKSARLPQIDLSLSASYLGNGRIVDRNLSHWQKAPVPHFGNSFALEASQIIYTGGAISADISLAKLQYQLAELSRENNRQELRFLLVANYLELYKLRNQEGVFIKNIEQTERLLQEIKAKHSEGLVIKNDITRYELELESLELALLEVRNTVEIINNQLVTVLALPKEVVIAVDTTLFEQLPQNSFELEWQEQAAQHSITLKQAGLGVEQSQQVERMVRSERLPSIALFAANQFNGPITIEIPPINKNINNWTVGVSLKYNLASLYKSSKKSNQALLSTQRAIEGEKLAKERLEVEVNQNYIRYIESFQAYNTKVKSLALAEQNYTTVNNRYLNDLALISDMLDATNVKLSAELDLANAGVNILFNLYKLKRLTANL